jgi:hypothetical protein
LSTACIKYVPVWAGADAVRLVEVNFNKMGWIQFEITAHSAGTATATCTMTQRVQ